MADDINKKITIDVQVNTDAQQTIDKYKTSFDNLRIAINSLGKPLEQLNDNISVADKNLSEAGLTVGKYLGKATAETQKSIAQQVAIVKDGEEQKSKTIIGTFIQTAGKVLGLKRILSESTQKMEKKDQDARRKSELDNAQKISDSVFTVVTKGIEQRNDAQIRGLEETRKAIDNNASLSAADKKTQENIIYKQEDAVKLKSFKAEQKANIGQAIMNGALAITKAEAELGPIAGTIAIAAIVANTAAQVATIERQQPPPKLATYAKGGYFQSDGKGAVLPGYSRTDNTNAYLRSGEAVVVSEAIRDPWARNLVSAINVAYGGRDFSIANPSRGYAVGGIFTDGGNANRYYNQPVTDQKNLANTIAYQMINNFPPAYVDVKDVNNQQNILAQTVNRVNL
ncbi:MAG TPA: hypothetical protein VJ844_07150 [Mucilaginibacter sp.]|nr:hypothetical protein [Mucilaginibacter sp.]